jgi:predicted permease
MPLTVLRRLWRRVKYRHFDRDLRQEIASHKAMAEEALRAGDAEAGAAERQAARQLGNITLQRERSRAVWMPLAVEQLLQDARYASRSLRRRPGFTIAAAVMLMVGMSLLGGSYSLFNGFFIRGWNLPDSDRLFVVRVSRATVGSGTTSNGLTLRAYRHLAAGGRAADYVAFGTDVFRIGPTPEGRGDQTMGLFVSDNFMSAVRLPLQLGPGLPRHPEGQPAVVISDRRWRRTFDADSGVIGRTAWINGTPVTVAGVLASGFDGLGPQGLDAVVALRDAPALALAGMSARVTDETACCLTIAGRLRDGWTPAQAEQEARLLIAQHRQSASLPAVRLSLTDTSTAASMNSPRGRTLAMVFALTVAASVLVWLLSCANVGNLYLAQSLRRRNEVAVRLALGANRARIVRQLLTEGLVLAALSGAGAYALTATLPLVLNLAEDVPTSLFPADWRVSSVVAGAAVLTSLLVSLAPALQITQAPGQRTTARFTPGRNRLRSILLAAQIALATVLVLSAALLTRSIGELTDFETDYALRTTSTITIVPSPFLSSEAKDLALKQAVAALSSASDLPLAALNSFPASGLASLQNVVSEPGSDMTVEANLLPMSDDAFRVLELPLVRGRFASNDPVAAEAVINERLAELMWPGGQALGRHLMVHFDSGIYRVVGVVRDSHVAGLDRVRPLVHIAPRADLPAPMFIARTTPGLEERVQAVVASLSPSVLARVSPLAHSMRQAIENAAAGAAVAGGLGLSALLLSMLGVFTVFTCIVEERRRDVGIRIALGASRSQIRVAMFRATRGAVVGGLAAGWALSVAAGYILRGFLHGLSPMDPVSYAAVAGLLAGSAALATGIPVRRALRIDPVAALRD